MNSSLFLIFFLCLAGCALAQRGGAISIAFTGEDPTTPQEVAADIVLGQSLEGTITLTPPPNKPLRFNIVSTIPQIIEPTHERVSFTTGQSEGVFTLVSPPDGSIGFVTLVISPEIPGTYVPLSFEVLVRGFSSAALTADVTCVAAGLPVSIELTIDPIAPHSVSFNVQGSNGEVEPSSFVILNGQNSAIVEFTGEAIATSSVTFSSDVYVPVTINFNTLGQIKTVRSSIITAAAPSQITVSTVPTNSDDVVVTTSNVVNLENYPLFFTIPAEDVIGVEVIANVAGSASLTYTAPNYCPHIDQFQVNAAPICSVGYHTNYFSTQCAICPGNNVFTQTFNNACYNRGECTYSSCFTSLARCVCDNFYVGAACQWDPSNDFYYAYSNTNNAFTANVNNVQNTNPDEPVVFNVPDTFVSSNTVGGSVIIAPYTSANPVFINPAAAPPSGTTPTLIGWRFEVTCPDNTADQTTFNSAVNVVLTVDDSFTQYQLALTDIYYYDTSVSGWREASRYCTADQYNYEVDFHDRTISTFFCRPGQYNIFVAPPPPLPANTGNSLKPHPTEGELVGTYPTTGVTGNNPIPPPLPVFTNTAGDPSPAQKFVDEVFANSSSLLSYSSLLFAILLIFLF